ncbi:hypothetical protein Tco_1323598, partial [Tanacetum coccineum]
MVNIRYVHLPHGEPLRIKQLLSEFQASDEEDDGDLLRECVSNLQGKVDDITQQYSDVTTLPDHGF